MNDEGPWDEADQTLSERRAQLDRDYSDIIARHKTERAELDARHIARREEETTLRADRLKTGLSALWQSITGKRRDIIQQNPAGTAL